MQTLSGPGSNGLSPQSRKVAVIAVALFALSGLISGFAVGAFVHPKSGTTNNNNGGSITPIVQQTKKATPSPTPVPQKINIQGVDGFESFEQANGTTYTLTSHLKTVLGSDGQPVNADNLTCKLWLIARVPQGQIISIPSDILKNVATINQPFTSQATQNGNLLPNVTYPEIQSALNFNTSTSQTHACSTEGEVTWRYQVSPSVTPGDYSLIWLYDWSGIHYDWYWVYVTIKAADSN